MEIAVKRQFYVNNLLYIIGLIDTIC